MSSISLKELLIESAQLEDQLVMLAGELTPELEQSLMALETKIPEKITKYIGLMDRLEIEADNLHSKAQKYLMAQKSLSGLRDKLLANVKFQMINNGLNELKGTHESFTISRGKKSVVITDQAKLPSKYNPQTITTKPDKEAIREAIESGEVVPGSELTESYVLKRRVNK